MLEQDLVENLRLIADLMECLVHKERKRYVFSMYFFTGTILMAFEFHVFFMELERPVKLLEPV